GERAGTIQPAPPSRRLSFLRHFVFEPGLTLYLTLGTISVVIGLMVVTTVVDINSKRADVRQEMMQTGESFGAIANGVLTSALITNDRNEMSRFASGLWGQRDTSYVKIYDRTGRLWVGPGRDQYPQNVIDTSALTRVGNLQIDQRWTPDGLEVTAPVT